MTRRDRKHRRWSWWLIGTLAVLALVLGTWGIMRPGTKEEADAPRTAKVKKSTKKEQSKKKEKTTREADRAEKATDQPAVTTTAGSDDQATVPANTDDTATPASSNGQVTNDNPATTTEQDNSAYDSPSDAAAGTAVGAELNNLVAELNKLASQYTEFQDVDAFNSGLANIQARNNQLLAQATTNADRNLATKINGAITRMQADPANAQSIANHIWH